MVAEGGNIYTVAAKSPEGQWVALTEVFVYDANPRLGTQSLTGVLQSHRQKGLAKLLKLMMLRYLLKHTQVTHIITGNATYNDAILKINEYLGFRPSVIYNIYELDVTTLDQTLPWG